MCAYIPTLFVAPSPESETLGASMSSYIYNSRVEDMRPILKKYNLETIETEKWYPMQLALDVVKDIVDRRENVLEDLVAVGVKTVETAPLQPEFNSIESAMHYVNQAAKLTSRHVPDDFGAPLKIISPQHILVTNNIPFPSSLLYGYIWRLVNRFKAPDQIFSIRTMPQEPGKPVVFSVKWGLPDEMDDK